MEQKLFIFAPLLIRRCLKNNNWGSVNDFLHLNWNQRPDELQASAAAVTSSVRVVRICDSQWLNCQIWQPQNELTLPALIEYRLQDNDVVVEHLAHWESDETQTVRNSSLDSSVSNFPSDQTTRLQEHRPHTSGQTASNEITRTMRWEDVMLVLRSPHIRTMHQYLLKFSHEGLNVCSFSYLR